MYLSTNFKSVDLHASADFYQDPFQNVNILWIFCFRILITCINNVDVCPIFDRFGVLSYAPDVYSCEEMI